MSTDNLLEIFKSWIIALSPTELEGSRAAYRLAVCVECDELNISKMKCKQCGCPIKKKIFSPKFNACPLEKWERADTITSPEI